MLPLHDFASNVRSAAMLGWGSGGSSDGSNVNGTGGSKKLSLRDVAKNVRRAAYNHAYLSLIDRVAGTARYFESLLKQADFTLPSLLRLNTSKYLDPASGIHLVLFLVAGQGRNEGCKLYCSPPPTVDPGPAGTTRRHAGRRGVKPDHHIP